MARLPSYLIFIITAIPFFAFGQQPGGMNTAEDSLAGNWLERHNTSIGGYGDAFYQHDFDKKTATINLDRVVLFVGHKFSKRISFFSELEVENAKVTSGISGGEIAFEQAYLKFNINQNHYLVAGLFIPRLGIQNENHLPNTFNGNERTRVETLIIPTTWRDLGIGYYGSATRIPLNWSFALLNGLNNSAFVHGTGVAEGIFEGRNASAENLAITGSVQYHIKDLRIQASAYYGGTVGLSPRQADSLKLTSGVFGTPVVLGELDAIYEANGFSAKVLGCILGIPNASDINRAYANNTAQLEYGGYLEFGYNIFQQVKKIKTHQLIVFARYEKLDVNAAIPTNGVIDGTLNQNHLVIGFGYLPIKNVVIKADVRLVKTGNQNPDLVLNPNPAAQAYQTQNTFLNIGVGFSF